MADSSTFSYRGSWCAEGLQTSWKGQWRIVGSNRTLLCDGHEDLRAEVVASPRHATGIRPEALFAVARAVPIPPPVPRDRIGGHAGVMRDFIDAVRAGTELEPVGREHIHSLAMVFGSIDSAATGRRHGFPPTQ